MKNVSKRCCRDLICLVILWKKKDYIMTLNIISPFPYLNYVPQILPSETTFEYLFNRVNTNSLSLALWLNWGSDESQMWGWFLWCGVSMYVWECAHVYVPINSSNNPGKQKKCWMGVLWAGRATEQNLCCALLVNFQRLLLYNEATVYRRPPSEKCVFVCTHVCAQNKKKNYL